MKHPIMRLSVIFAAAMSFSLSAMAWDPVNDALTTMSKFNMNFRMRYETVDDASPVLEDGDALTLRSRMTYESGAYKNFSVGLEMDDVTALMPEDYNDDVNGNLTMTKITDPEGTEVNQAWVNYAGVPSTQVKWGRQRIVLDNERFIGSVGFRQNEQTYDALTVTNKSLPKTTVFYSYINNVNRIFGEDNAAGDHESNTHLFNAKYEGFTGLALTAYAYMLDDQAPTLGAYTEGAYSSDTFGIRAAGKQVFGDQTLKYTAEFATQHEADNNPKEYSANYSLVELTYGIPAVNGVLGYEVLGADNHATLSATGATAVDQGFQTPLATLHKFQGWADQLIGGGSGNLPVGIEDAYIGLEGKMFNLLYTINYHQYNAANETATVANLGTEWGASLEKKWGNYSVIGKYASYSADDSEALLLFDKNKFWLTLQAAF
jgi:hypothetical protein